MSADEDVCWICLAGASTLHPLTRPCKCPRVVHAQCLARWQLRRIDTAEGKHCRFCAQRLPKWTAAAAAAAVSASDGSGMGGHSSSSSSAAATASGLPQSGPEAAGGSIDGNDDSDDLEEAAEAAIVTIHFGEGESYKVALPPGAVGRRAFEREVERLTGAALREDGGGGGDGDGALCAVTFLVRDPFDPAGGSTVALDGLRHFGDAMACATLAARARARAAAAAEDDGVNGAATSGAAASGAAASGGGESGAAHAARAGGERRKPPSWIERALGVLSRLFA